MRQPNKNRSRNKNNRNKSMGNVTNRVFDSAGPEGKVRGTPSQIIEKYQTLARDAQLSGDRVNAENFLQHSEHYTRLLAEAQRQQDAQNAKREQEQAERQQQREQQRDDAEPEPAAAEASGESDLVETPEQEAPKPRRRRRRNNTQDEGGDQGDQPTLVVVSDDGEAERA